MVLKSCGIATVEITYSLCDILFTNAKCFSVIRIDQCPVECIYNNFSMCKIILNILNKKKTLMYYNHKTEILPVLSHFLIPVNVHAIFL